MLDEQTMLLGVISGDSSGERQSKASSVWMSSVARECDIVAPLACDRKCDGSEVAGERISSAAYSTSGGS